MPKESLLDAPAALVLAFFIAVEYTYCFAESSAVMQFAILIRAAADGGWGNYAEFI